MPLNRINLASCVALASSLALAPGLAHAALGTPLSAASRDGHVVTSPQRQAAKALPAGVQTLTVQTPEGTSVTEYASADGTVFALTWHGALMPDLEQLLGAYFPSYRQLARQGARGLTASVVDGDAIVVHSFGRMHAFSGLAWVPALLPAGFDPAELQP